MKNALSKKLKQVPKEHLVVGIDPHKKKHAAVVITQDFSILAKFKFDNTRAGLESMLERAKEEMVKSNCRGIMFAISCARFILLSFNKRESSNPLNFSSSLIFAVVEFE